MTCIRPTHNVIALRYKIVIITHPFSHSSAVEFVMGFRERQSETHTSKFALMAALSCPPWLKHMVSTVLLFVKH